MLQHEFARSTDPVLLDFLREVRTQRPDRHRLESFFGERMWGESEAWAIWRAMQLEGECGKPFCFLTVTNRAAARFNYLRLRTEFAEGRLKYEFGGGVDLNKMLEESIWEGDPKACSGKMIFAKGMRIRLTRNLDKDRGFVNGAIGTIVCMLSPCNFILKTDRGIMLMVHPVAQDGKVFMPCSYGYAMTIRRAQGSTLGLVALCFDQPHYPAEKAYAYVGASRVRYAKDLFYFGKLRTSDWTPCGMERMDRGFLSESDASDAESDRSEGHFDIDWPDSEHSDAEHDECDYDGENSDDDRWGRMVSEDVEGYEDSCSLFE